MSGSTCVKRSVRLEMRRDTSVNWATKNPRLLPGEPGFEIDTGKLKIGNGTSLWNDLLYIGTSTGPTSLLDGGGPLPTGDPALLFDLGSVS